MNQAEYVLMFYFKCQKSMLQLLCLPLHLNANCDMRLVDVFCLGCPGERTSQTRQHVQVFADAGHCSSKSGTHYRQLFSVVTLLQFLSLG